MDPHFMTREGLMFSNPTPGELCLFPTAILSDDMLSAPTLPLYYSTHTYTQRGPGGVRFLPQEQKVFTRRSGLDGPNRAAAAQL